MTSTARADADVASHGASLATSAAILAAATAATVAWCAPMSAMAGMPMPGGWTMSTVWMRMGAQTWPGVAASFLGMWIVMMAGMMAPSLVPMLWRYRLAVSDGGATSAGGLTVLTAAGYFVVWTLFGIVAFPVGVALTEAALHLPAVARAVPLFTAAVVLIAGALQFTAWKAQQLAGCRAAPGCAGALPADARTAWRHGLRLGLHCSRCCAGLTAILLVTGVTDLRAMALVATAITAERLAPAGARVARGIGVVAICGGLFLTARAAGLR